MYPVPSIPTERTDEHHLQAYAAYALNHPHRCKVVAMAEPRYNTRAIFAKAHAIDDTLVFNTWQDLLKVSTETLETVGKRLADAVIVAVQDHMHKDVVLAFAQQGYHILCEKPMATNLGDLVAMEKAVNEARIIFGMGHGIHHSSREAKDSSCLHSVALLTVRQGSHRSSSLRPTGRARECRACRACWLLPLCPFVCPG